MTLVKRNVWFALIALVLAAAIAAGVFFYGDQQQAPVSVYAVDMISYKGQTNGVAESYGVVTADQVQTIYVSDTQRVTRIYVYDGQQVRKGDLLYTYDTTLTDLQLERKDLSIQQMEVNLKTARADLKKLNAMKPMVVTTPPVSEVGKSPANQAMLGTVYDGKGTAAKPYLFWMVDGAELTQDMVWELFALEGKTDIFVVFQSVTGDKTNAEFTREFGVQFTAKFVQPEQPAETTPSEDAEQNQPEASEPTESAPAVESVRTYTMRFFNPNGEENGTQIDWNSGYTQSELTAMREQKAEEIRELEFSIRIGKAELEIMRKEASDGNVFAEFDGVVVSVLNPSSAKTLGQPIIKVTGGGGYYVEGTVSENERDTMQVGLRVTVNSWGTGDSYSGTVAWVGQYPVEEENVYNGETGVTYYPYRVFVDEGANLKEGTYVSMICHSSQSGSSVLYVENAFLVNEGRNTFAYVRNSSGLLEKRYLTVGVSTDGYATPVYEGLREADYIAFPYDKNLREGAETVIKGTDGLYGW